MFRPDRAIKISAQIAKNSRLNPLDLATKNIQGATARRPFNVIREQTSKFSTSTPKFKDNTGGKDMPLLPEIVKNKKPTSALGNLPSLPTDKSVTNSIQQAATHAFKQTEQNPAAIGGLTNLAERFPAIRNALLQKDILDRPNIDAPKISESNSQTSKRTEIKIYYWEDATDNRTIYTHEQEDNMLANAIINKPELKDKIEIIHYAQESREFNCHGYTFGNKAGWIDNRDAQKILDDDFEPVEKGTKHSLPADLSKLQEGSRLVFRLDPEKMRYMRGISNLDDEKAKKRIEEIRKEGEDILHSGFVSVKDNKLYLDNKGGLTRGVWDQPIDTLESEYGSYYEIYNPKE